MEDGFGTEEGRIAGRLKAAAGRVPVSVDSGTFVERVLARGTDRLFTCGSPIGEVFVGVSDLGVRMIGRARSPEEFARHYRGRFGRLLSDGTDARTRRLAERVAAALAGERVKIPVDLSGTTPFQRRVLEVVSGIPRGEVRPYGWVAGEVGSPQASRAVGTVMANNPVPLLIPCHRVVRNDGTTGNYAFGAEKKVGLLHAEGVPVEEMAGAPYVATPTTRIVCNATCRNAKRIKPENRRRFRRLDDALEAGYRPCEVCRPGPAAVAR